MAFRLGLVRIDPPLGWVVKDDIENGVAEIPLHPFLDEPVHDLSSVLGQSRPEDLLHHPGSSVVRSRVESAEERVRPRFAYAIQVKKDSSGAWDRATVLRS